MNKAYIFFNDENNKDYNGEGPYVLVFNDKVIASHYCSNRSFANHDLTVWKLEQLEQNDIKEVYSNDRLVWKKRAEEINKITQAEFEIAEDNYIAKNCF